jgi:hypothetical protein
MTWFRREPEVEWFKGFGDDAQIQKDAAAKVRDTLHHGDR